ncbi:MAG TPA: hypothetical protein VJX23_01590 [Candidatus Binataceae bacterium]|nr:hypothetical protein [Candidatus Binataceae bacterium]
MKKAAFVIFVLGLVLSSCAYANAQANPLAVALSTPSYVFSAVGSDLETRAPVAAVGRAQIVSGNQITGQATLNDGGQVCTARVSGIVRQSPDGGADAFLTLSTETGHCPSPLEFRGVLSGSINAFIEVDSKLVTAGAAWRQ